MKKRRPRLQRYTCSNEDGSDPLRVLATDHMHAAEKYFRAWVEADDEDAASEQKQNCIGSVRVVCPVGVVYDVTVQSQLVLDVEAMRSKRCS
ncbi:MAG TPA: hypothetical protein VLT45_21025 [Kofleriaceae bacterium]|nr:hypothetical protein [Kofleriaceae bacterium]